MNPFTGADMVFNNQNFDRLLYVEDIRRDFITPQANDFVRIGNANKHIKNRLSPRTIEVDVRLIDKTRWEVGRLRNKIAGMLYSETVKPLFLRDTTDFDMAILDGRIQFDRLLYTGFATLNFINPSGLVYRRINEVNVTSKIINLGTFQTYAQIELKSTSTSRVRVVNKTTSNFVELTRAMTTSDNVQFGRLHIDDPTDFDEIALFNGQNDMLNLSHESNFIKLIPGLNEFEIIGADSIKVSYWECYV